MRTCVEARRFELVPGVRKECADLCRQLDSAPGKVTIDVVHAEADAFHVKGPDRADERLAFLNQRGNRCRLSMRFQPGDDGLHSRLRGLTMIGGGHVACRCSVLSRDDAVNASNRVHPIVCRV
jgi:hypothetical protein